MKWLRAQAARARRAASSAAGAVSGFVRRNLYEIGASALSALGAAIFQHALGALLRLPLAVVRTEMQHRAAEKKRREGEALRSSCIATIGVATVELLDGHLVLDAEVIFRLSHDEPLTIRHLAELSASGKLLQQGWIAGEGYRLSTRLRKSWQAFETATSRCAGVLTEGPTPRLVDALVLAVKESEHAAYRLWESYGRAMSARGVPDVAELAVAQEEYRRRFTELGRTLESAVRAGTELERLANPEAAGARAAEVLTDRTRRRQTRLAADRIAATAARRIRVALADADELHRDRERFGREIPPGTEYSQPVLELVRQIYDELDVLVAAVRRGASAEAIARAREQLRRTVKEIAAAAERQQGEHDAVEPRPR